VTTFGVFTFAWHSTKFTVTTFGVLAITWHSTGFTVTTFDVFAITWHSTRSTETIFHASKRMGLLYRSLPFHYDEGSIKTN